MTIAPPDRVRRTVARAITEVLAPVVLIFVVLLVVAIHATGDWLRGLWMGLLAAFFAGGLPYLVLITLVRRGRLADRHLSLRHERPAMMLFGLVSVSVGLWAMNALGAPGELLALVIAMVAGVAVALAISSFWKISIHTACVAGTVTVLAMLVHPVLALLAPLVVATAWARVALRDHTAAQVIAGAVVGAGVAAAVLVMTSSLWLP